MQSDLARLAEHASMESRRLRQNLEQQSAELTDHARTILDTVITIAGSAVNHRGSPSRLEAELIALAARTAEERLAARVLRRGGIDAKSPLYRTLSARTLHTLRELGLYKDPNSVEPVWPHAGMLILNPMLGCSFGCAYCFRADEQRESVDWFLNGRPTKVLDEDTVIERLGRHPLFVPGVTQLGLHTATTEPFLPQVRESTFRLLDLLEEKGWGNDVMIITKHFVRDMDVERLASYRAFRILLFLTYNAAPAEMETMGASPGFQERRQRTVEMLTDHPQLSAAHYYRPIVPGWNDSDEQIADALLFGEPLGLTVIGGLKQVPGLPEISARRGLSLPVVSKGDGDDKHFPPELVERILKVHHRLGLTSTIVGDQSCGLTVMLSRRLGRAVPNVEAVGMYDAATGRRPKCMGLCTPEQLAACGSPPVPERTAVQAMLDAAGVPAAFHVADDGVRLHSVDAPGKQQIESLAAHLRYAVFWQPAEEMAEAPDQGRSDDR
jgi:hypothetical protein